MVQFHEHIITDLLEGQNGGLVILSSGLSLPKLISSLLLLHDSSQGTLLILSPSSSPSLKTLILHHHLKNDDHQTIAEITADLPAHHRLSLYSSGQICFITPRILIVDLLTNRIPITAISGLIILNAHALSETSTEAFIARILKTLGQSQSQNQIYIRAFTDKPHAMVMGFSKTERIMKALYVKKLHLWPRFQVYVSEELERSPPEVVDVRVGMSKYMMGIQKAIIEVMDACLKEMRKTNKVDVEDLSVENGLFKSFDEIVKRQLDPIWHILGRKTKQLVSDLKTLRKLLDYLVRYDAVSYLKYLDTLRVSESFRSVWIFAESSFKIFDYAKKRVYRLGRSNGDAKVNGANNSIKGRKRKLKACNETEEAVTEGTSSSNPNGGVVLEEVLEASPKWKVLREILEEIEEERRKQDLLRENNPVENEETDNGIVLVACKDECSCMQLENFITNGSQKVLREEWEKYLLSKVELRDLPTPQKKKFKKRETKGFGILDGVVPVTTAQNADASSSNKQERDALLAAASEIRNQQRKIFVVEDELQPVVDNKKGRKARGKVQNKRGRTNAQTSGEDNVENEVKMSDKSEMPSTENEAPPSENNQPITEGYQEVNSKASSLDQGVLRRHTQQLDSSSCNAKHIPPVHFYAQESDQPVLDILKPSAIVVYHPDMTFVREIEVYKAENPSKKVKVYFLFYEDSTEVQKFEASIRRENGAFESLIRQKSMMMIPVDQD
ncbi:DNA repair endonuclease UVH1 isoform X2 [Mercurialis annua]|uniref:DNA repair endonuclease UVH1 isoform X2 n=1 Tax=Mercurialis annua TaxID=3986 RepID=UPI00215FB243|nr:DNA repair endonuclease UVH1 isoform X2 [Mercurialis annua]